MSDLKDRHVFSGPDDPNMAILIIGPYRIELVKPGEFEPEVWQA